MTILQPIRTLSAIYPVRFRADLPREVADTYWAGTHAELVKQGGHIFEYNQLHLSENDHGYWPATPTVGTHPADLFRWDGVTEVRLRNIIEMARAAYGMLDTIFHDEQNVFDNVLGHVCGPRGATWWTDRHDPAVDHRTLLLLRRRRGVPVRKFRVFVHERFGPALQASGGLDVRTYSFVPMTGVTHRTPGPLHSYPPSHHHDGAVVFGLPKRDDFDRLVAQREMKDLIADQAAALTAVHAYAVDRTVPVIEVPR